MAMPNSSIPQTIRASCQTDVVSDSELCSAAGKPTLYAPPEVKGHLGANVSIPCRVRSYLPMTAGWYFGDQPFSAFKNYKLVSELRYVPDQT